MATLAEIQQEMRRRDAEAVERDKRRQAAYDLAVQNLRTEPDLPASEVHRGPIVIGDFQFATKAEAKTMTQTILRSIRDNGMTDDAQAFLQALVRNYPNYAAKIPREGYTVFVTRNGGLVCKYPGREPGWWTDGVTVAVQGCLGVQTHRSRVTGAARKVMWTQKPQVYEAKLVCSICDSPIPNDDLHWDHAPRSFSNLFREWRVSSLLRWEDIPLDPLNNTDFAYLDMAESWATFHAEHASLRPTHSKCNLTNRTTAEFIYGGERPYDISQTDGLTKKESYSQNYKPPSLEEQIVRLERRFQSAIISKNDAARDLEAAKLKLRQTK